MKNNTKTFKGKAIYNPSGKAGEYSYWACNFYIGCSNGCTYCYLKKGVLAHAMGGDKPKLKACFKNEEHALEVFQKELLQNIDELRKHGLFFSFTTDPLLKEVEYVTWASVMFCNDNDVPVKILTKRADWVEPYLEFIENSNSDNKSLEWRKLIAFGFTLTGCDELEPCASLNMERIEAMRLLHDAGFKTFASIEPIIDFEMSERMISRTKNFCDLYKIGLESGKRYSKNTIVRFMNNINLQLSMTFPIPKVYWKDSLINQAEVLRSELPENCVNRDYNLFK